MSSPHLPNRWAVAGAHAPPSGALQIGRLHDVGDQPAPSPKRLLTAAVVSVFLLAVVIGVWVASYRRSITFDDIHGNAVYRLTAVDGIVGLTMRKDGSVNDIRVARYEIGGLVLHYGIDRGWTDATGTDGTTHHAGLGVFYWRVAVPLWLTTACLLVLPICAMLNWPRWRGEKRRRRGLCPACGYDLRASGTRYPECGEPVAVASNPRLSS